MLTKSKAISEGHGDTALLLLKAGAETDKKDVDGLLAIDLAPDTKVCHHRIGPSMDDFLISHHRYGISSCRKQSARELTSCDQTVKYAATGFITHHKTAQPPARLTMPQEIVSHDLTVIIAWYYQPTPDTSVSDPPHRLSAPRLSRSSPPTSLAW